MTNFVIIYQEKYVFLYTSTLRTKFPLNEIFGSLRSILREKVTSNKTPAFTKSMSMFVWVVGTSNQLFMRFLKQNKISKKIK